MRPKPKQGSAESVHNTLQFLKWAGVSVTFVGILLSSLHITNIAFSIIPLILTVAVILLQDNKDKRTKAEDKKTKREMANLRSSAAQLEEAAVSLAAENFPRRLSDDDREILKASLIQFSNNPKQIFEVVVSNDNIEGLPIARDIHETLQIECGWDALWRPKENTGIDERGIHITPELKIGAGVCVSARSVDQDRVNATMAALEKCGHSRADLYSQPRIYQNGLIRICVGQKPIG